MHVAVDEHARRSHAIVARDSVNLQRPEYTDRADTRRNLKIAVCQPRDHWVLAEHNPVRLRAAVDDQVAANQQVRDRDRISSQAGEDIHVAKHAIDEYASDLPVDRGRILCNRHQRVRVERNQLSGRADLDGIHRQVDHARFA